MQLKFSVFLNVNLNVKLYIGKHQTIFKTCRNSIKSHEFIQKKLFSRLKSIPKWIVVELMIEKCSYRMWPRLLLHKNNNQLRNHYAQLLLCLVSSIFYWEEGLLRFWIHEYIITWTVMNKIMFCSSTYI